MAVETELDSGAMKSVAPPEMLPYVPIQPSEGSLQGQEFVVADGNTIPNMGQKEIDCVDAAGDDDNLTYQISRVGMPLTSVGDLCDAGEKGHLVIFGARGGIRLNLATQQITPFTRVNRRYKWTFWAKKPGQTKNSAPSCEYQSTKPDFHRPGK